MAFDPGFTKLNRIDWTSERLSALEAMWCKGQSAAKIGKAVGASRNAVMRRVNRLGLTRHGRKNAVERALPWSDDAIDTLRRVWLTARADEIASMLGRTVSAVEKMGHRLKLPNKNRNPFGRKLTGFTFRARKVRSPVSKVRVLPEPPPMRPVDLFARTGCCFPVNDGGPFLFCNNSKERGDYCSYHHQVMRRKD